MSSLGPIIPCTAQQIWLEDSEDALHRLRRYVVYRMKKRLNDRSLIDAYLQFMGLLRFVQDMQRWRKLADPGIAAKLIGMGPEWEAEIPDARMLDRNSQDQLRELREEFEAMGGREGMQIAIDALNAAAGF